MNSGKASTADTPLGSFTLQRYPRRRGEQKRAWNSADLLLLDYAVNSGITPANTLVVNDEFGALAIPLGSQCCLWSDSALAQRALLQNAGLSDDDLADAWIKACEEVAPEKDEDDFTEQDWAAVSASVLAVVAV